MEQGICLEEKKLVASDDVGIVSIMSHKTTNEFWRALLCNDVKNMANNYGIGKSIPFISLFCKDFLSK